MQTYEVNFDGLIGPTHNYAGLSHGNLASTQYSQTVSHPRAAAKQGLDKMRCMVELGYQQGVLLPQIRPDLSYLRRLGFDGSDENLIAEAARQSPMLLTRIYSASSMWAANAATVTPSIDSADGKVHFSPANLISTSHRALEPGQTMAMLRHIFPGDCFNIHEPLPGSASLGDEGAANHSRLCASYGSKGLSLFVYGRDEFTSARAPTQFPARQTLLASQAVARQHGVLDNAVFLQQQVAAIDAGAFHNDVVAVANGPVLFFHEQAYYLGAIERIVANSGALRIQPICVSRDAVPLGDVIKSYLFNSQLLASPEGSMEEMTLIAPLECREVDSTRNYLQQLMGDFSQPIRQVIFVDLRQSMCNGGGPACLRLRVVLNEVELQCINQAFLMDTKKLDALEAWVDRNYREDLSTQDLGDPVFMREAYAALDELKQVMDSGFVA